MCFKDANNVNNVGRVPPFCHKTVFTRATPSHCGPGNPENPEPHLRNPETIEFLVPKGRVLPPPRIRSLQDGPGPRWTSQGPIRRIRAPLDESGPRRTKQVPAGWIGGPKDEPGSRKTNLGPAPVRRTRVPQDESGFCRTDLGPAERIRAPWDEPVAKSKEFLVLRVPWSPAWVRSPKSQSCGRPWDLIRPVGP